VSNACKYSPPKSEVFLIVNTDIQVNFNGDNGSPHKAVVVCSVRDTGYGISEEDQVKLFTKFFRAGDPNIRQSSGTGLGLSITKGIIELHGGAIWFESKLGEGTTFHFTIPQVNGQA
jgi:signal transduction histidine kinase